MSGHLTPERLSAYLDDELGGPERAGAEGHLRACASCARHLEELLTVDASARALGVAAPPLYFDRFPARLRERLTEEAARPRRVPVWAWAAAAGILLAVVAPLTLDQMKPMAPAAEAPVAGPPAQAPAGAARDMVLPEPVAPPPATAPAAEGKAQAAAAPPPPARAQERERAEPKKSADAPRAPAAVPVDPVGAAGVQGAEEPLVDEADPRVAKPKEERGRLAAPPPAASAQPTGASPAAPGPFAVAEVDAEAAGGRGDAAALKSERQARRATGNELGLASQTAAGQTAFAALSRRPQRTPEEARALRDDWVAYAGAHADHPLADEARVRALEAAATAYRLGADEADRTRLESDAAAYLRRPDARQRARVRALLDALD